MPSTPLPQVMIGRWVSRASATTLAVGGIALLFASDVVLPRLAPALPPGAAWIGQLVAAGWLAVAAVNWTGQSTLIGGIYGRPLVTANFALYFVTATSVLRPALDARSPRSIWLVAVPSVAFAAMYGWLLLRGPFERDFEEQAGKSRSSG